MLSDNIRKYRKSKHMSQDELAEKLEVTRQSISLWETGQTQPSLDNIVALAKLFDISTDSLLTQDEPKSVGTDEKTMKAKKITNKKAYILIAAAIFVLVAALITTVFLWKSGIFSSEPNSVADPDPSNVTDSTESSIQNQSPDDKDNTSSEEINKNEDEAQSVEADKTEDKAPEREEETKEAEKTNNTEDKTQTVVPDKTEEKTPEKAEKPQQPLQQTNNGEDTTQTVVPDKTEEKTPQKPQTPSNDNSGSEEKNQPAVSQTPEVNTKKDIFGYLKNFVIQNGIINGDYCYYSNSADTYGGYPSERFSLYYWGDTDKIEFCLHSVMDDTFSINFYLYVPKTHTGEYEYISSYYYRDTGEPLYEAKGIINAGEFTKKYPLNCTKYIGSTDIQNEFMEMSRQGICDLIDCLEQFIAVEKLKYSFHDFGFVKF